MESRYYQLPRYEREVIKHQITDFLRKRREILFAYLHGSFLDGPRFRDIDIALFLDTPSVSTLKYELELESQMSRSVKNIPIEARILNQAPLSFRYAVIKRGVLLFSRRDELKSEFIERAINYYLDFAPFHRRYLKEALTSGIRP
jgi:predicted nucleotidyltransferase